MHFDVQERWQVVAVVFAGVEDFCGITQALHVRPDILVLVCPDEHVEVGHLAPRRVRIHVDEDRTLEGQNVDAVVGQKADQFVPLTDLHEVLGNVGVFAVRPGGQEL